MAQITSGFRAILSYPIVYSFFQHIMGAHQFRSRFVRDFIKTYEGMGVLDIGCGPADILEYLHSVDYWGFDISNIYIKQARIHFGTLGKFHCQELKISDLGKMPTFDIVLALGLLHHLDDEIALNVIKLSWKALKPGGRLLTVDPVVVTGQNRFARFLINHDRGQNVRDMAGYTSLVKTVFKSSRTEIRHQNWVPYTHCIMECKK